MPYYQINKNEPLMINLDMQESIHKEGWAVDSIQEMLSMIFLEMFLEIFLAEEEGKLEGLQLNEDLTSDMKSI